MSVMIDLKALVFEGVRYWRATDVLNFMNELLIAAHTEEQRIILAHGIRTLQKALATELSAEKSHLVLRADNTRRR